MKKYSKNLRICGDIVLVVAIITILVGFIAWTLGYGAYVMASGFGILVLSPLFKGFSVLVESAEWQLDDRFKKNVDVE